MKLILASQSKRRQEMLKGIGLNFEVMVSYEEEIYDEKLTPLQNCQNISYEKANDIFKRTDGNRIIISCDTMVIKDDLVYGKPKNREDAYNMLEMLSGTNHQVISCLTVIKVKDNQKEEYKTYDTGIIYIDSLSSLEINDWIDNNNPYDKAGGYAIQEGFGKHVKKIEGDYFSIVGLPLNKLYNILKEIDE